MVQNRALQQFLTAEKQLWSIMRLLVISLILVSQLWNTLIIAVSSYCSDLQSSSCSGAQGFFCYNPHVLQTRREKSSLKLLVGAERG